MIHVYENGKELVEEHRSLLNTNSYLSMFFFLDAKALKTTDKSNFAISCTSDGETLLVMKVEPFSMLLFGDAAPLPELAEFLIRNHYSFESVLGSEQICEAFAAISREKYGQDYVEALAMDFMEAREITEPSCPEVEIPTESDLDMLYECSVNFNTDCGLRESCNREHLRERLNEYRILRLDGKIVAMSSVGPATDSALKIANVYTRPEYRGRGLARKIVNTVKNDILEQGMTATLNVDKKNPVSYHLYESLGFRKVFSQGEYRRVT